MSKKTILVVEDEPDMAELVALRLRREGYEVALAHDGEEALRLVRSRPVDLVLLDLMLPRLSGTEVAGAIRRDVRTAHLPIVMLTAKGEEGDVVVGLQAGADDYVTKPFSMAVLTARVAAVLRRSASLEAGAGGQSTLTVGPIRIDRDRRRAEVAGREIALTATEFRLLLAILAARGRVLTRNQLIDQALGLDAVVTDRTIDVHLTALRRKLGRARRYIQTVRGIGYRLGNDHETT